MAARPSGVNRPLATAILRATALLVVVPLAVAPLGAQEFQTGTWTGTMVPPEGIPAPVAFEVTDDGGDVAITMTVEGTAPRPLESIELDGHVLRFSFTMGMAVECALERQPDGSFAGPCSGGPRQAGTIHMIPPG